MAKSYIKKIQLSNIETWIGKNLKRNTIVIGWDVAMRETGIAVMRTTNNSLILEQTLKISVPKNIKLLDSIDLFLSQLQNFKNKISKQYKIDKNVIEDCFFLRNVNTLKALARFGVLIYTNFKDVSKETIFIMPTTARSRIEFKKSGKGIKGKYLKKEIMNYINGLLGTKIKDNDIADAVVLALCGLIEEGE